jgi:hypothetical protein
LLWLPYMKTIPRFACAAYSNSLLQPSVLPISNNESFKLLFGTLIDIVMSILLPFFTTFSKSITQLTEEETEVLVCLRESILELLIQFIDCVLLGRILDEIVKELEILASMCQISLPIHFPAALQMSWDDLGGVQRCDEIK